MSEAGVQQYLSHRYLCSAGNYDDCRDFKTLEYTKSPSNVGAINWVNSNYTALSISASGIVTPHLPGRYSVSILLYYNGSYVSNDICYITALPQTSVSSGVYKIQNQSQGKYLTAKSNASVTLENGLPVGRDGSQLWFVENYGNFCVIYSLGAARQQHARREGDGVFNELIGKHGAALQ